jgi:geranylgeranyl diphosphate synthase type II
LNSSLDEYFRSRRSLVDEALDACLQPKEGLPESLREAMHYSLLAPGKRLRPMLVLLACEACGGSERSALPAACAVEMIHTYSLIHDDLPAMDDDELRRGRPTCHKKFGEALAILAGDGLLTLAFEVLAAGFAPPTAAACCLELARGAGICGMVGGQVDDLACERGSVGPAVPDGRMSGTAGPTDRLRELELLHGRKTGALFRTSLKLGVLAAGGDRSRLDLFDAYGSCFGQAFQITDDLLDVEGSAEQTGKRVHKDADRGKLTYPGLLGVEESRRRAERLCQDACRLLEPLGRGGDRLAQLARYVLERDR